MQEATSRPLSSLPRFLRFISASYFVYLLISLPRDLPRISRRALIPPPLLTPTRLRYEYRFYRYQEDTHDARRQTYASRRRILFIYRVTECRYHYRCREQRFRWRAEDIRPA